MAVLEALSHGLPCLLTPGTNVSAEIAEGGAGWEVPPTPEGIAQGIAEAIAGRDRLPAMGANARALSVREYDWGVVARKTVVAYRQCLERAGMAAPGGTP